MCLGVPAQIVRTHGPGRATVAMSGVQREISTDLLGDGIDIGEWVLVHVGFALARIDEAEAAETLKQIEQLGDAVLAEEVDAFSSSRISAGGDR